MGEGKEGGGTVSVLARQPTTGGALARRTWGRQDGGGRFGEQVRQEFGSVMAGSDLCMSSTNPTLESL